MSLQTTAGTQRRKREQEHKKTGTKNKTKGADNRHLKQGERGRRGGGEEGDTGEKRKEREREEKVAGKR